MSKEQVFCGAEKCSDKCPAYNGNDFSFIFCRIVKTKINTEESKNKAYQKMEEYYSLKIENDEK